MAVSEKYLNKACATLKELENQGILDIKDLILRMTIEILLIMGKDKLIKSIVE